MKRSQKILLFLTTMDLLLTLSWVIWGFTPILNNVMPFVFLFLSCSSLIATLYDINTSKKNDCQDKNDI